MKQILPAVHTSVPIHQSNWHFYPGRHSLSQSQSPSPCWHVPPQWRSRFWDVLVLHVIFEWVSRFNRVWPIHESIIFSVGFSPYYKNLTHIGKFYIVNVIYDSQSFSIWLFDPAAVSVPHYEIQFARPRCWNQPMANKYSDVQTLAGSHFVYWKIIMTLEAVYNIGYLKGSVIFNFGGLIYRKYDTFIDRSDSIKPIHPFKDCVIWFPRFDHSSEDFRS